MANSIKAVRSEEMRLKKKTSNVFEVLRSTLKDKVNSKETDIEKLIITRLGRKPVLAIILKKNFQLLSDDRKFFGLTKRSIKRMAFELAIKLSCPPFSVLQVRTC